MSLTVLWIVIGVALCLMELMIPSAFLESALGVSALGVALLSPVVPGFGGQVGLWMLFSLLVFWALRRFVPNQTPPALRDSTEARTLTSILPGQTGRVIYEGNSWQARCSDGQAAIAPNQAVVVVGRQGNTLIVLPDSVLQG
ncbi:MAG: NfeD family protein [Leptolyngbya sp. SIO4C1]|nr:NfeD family protein [Leptolyngbya sp. SIO4C1]